MSTSEGHGVLANISIPTGQGNAVAVEVRAGKPVFILGRNGTGKSALVFNLSRQLGQNLIYMPGSRPSYFDNESLSLTPASRRSLTSNLNAWNSQPDIRWRSFSGTSSNEKAIHDLQHAEIQYKIDAANDIKSNGLESEAVARLQSNHSPLDRVNSLLMQANFPVQMLIDRGELRAKQGGSIYSYAKMSDGERAALVFAAEVVAATSGTVFLIDEPELHLHPSIVVSLINAFLSERSDCGFIICTHELDLPVNANSASMILVRGSQWAGEAVAFWDIDFVEDATEIPEWLRVDLIGSRRKILFIEGVSTSLDQPLYALLFPSVSIRCRESCREVMRAVEGLRAVEHLHRAQAFGLVDHDGMGGERMTELEASGIYPLPIYAVESLYYSQAVLTALAEWQSKLFGISVEKMMADAYSAAVGILKQKNVAEHLAGRIAERQMRDRLLLEIPSRDELINGTSGEVNVRIPSPYPEELDVIHKMIGEGDVASVVSRYPVRESGVLGALAKGLHFSNRTDYERAALTIIAASDELRSDLKGRLGNIQYALA
ncbi:AAA family ATPase [Pseudomonas aeruginosa]|uniref:AAA family ATPase n=1 Tax=Pseudomonas aeruginosa TaxID=287 RepID=UPI00040F1AA8|nr:AAA family ATPase [Pseudomonas aeruginosa]MCO2127578.1 ATP-binding cassette domain-containing protein [Pseudomonas aeruginosa]MCO3023887.1 ATP-binding cassette domain-containing protein [Pseudomonas aeruginosa]MDS4323137.1 AAA family ATPase [Pseudomonas aeruginosa]MDV6702861.1 ATP-binding cassette domain-containing protein [Pseudomonas aeruginosa]HBO1870414.1 AAA family ATPase [Pseudomonas aeruginosa]